MAKIQSIEPNVADFREKTYVNVRSLLDELRNIGFISKFDKLIVTNSSREI